MGEVNEVIVVTVKSFVPTEQGQLNCLSLLNMVTRVRAQRDPWGRALELEPPLLSVLASLISLNKPFLLCGLVLWNYVT